MIGKKPGQPDSEEVLKIKALIRRTEAIAGAQCAGVPEDKLRFLDMPFYQTGKVEKSPITDADVQIIVDLFRELQPYQVYVAGDLSDPHGTHRMCAEAILAALKRVEAEGLTPEVWLYRGAWQEYEPYEIERVVPLSPELVERKKQAIFRHESQKDAALFPWQRQARVLGPRGRTHQEHRGNLQPARPARVLRPGRLRPVQGAVVTVERSETGERCATSVRVAWCRRNGDVRRRHPDP